MKGSKYLLATMFSTTLLISGLGFNSYASAETIDQQLQQEEIKLHKEAGMTQEQIDEFIKVSKEEREFIDKQANNLANKDKQELEELEKSGEIKDLYPKYGEKEYDSAYIQASGKMGTKGDVLVSYEINSGSSSIGVGHAAVVAQNNSNTIEAWSKGLSPLKQDGVRKFTNKWGNKRKVYGLWVKGASDTKYRNAAKYAESQASAKKRYNFNFFNKKTTAKFYCSQLAWRAWKNQGKDIDNIKDNIVTPMELVNSSATKIFQHNL
ncbi:YiiX/YebB-like N1pC/P60 family cysteine hydrolase [Bacillus atrophaeus]|uniref:YiiX/YebB-like N1pC/P60 family cysteine hydrolase n=1 Tax=Bacillus atrophaeus TaxID=1452 RepID=UPI002280FAAD|nr:YiiX/YebB-like N1pC/P60 family cysteine hydrolase [Bacillus atrophaeus]MCY8467314.1 septation ring formation regulator EzrA [Bacillus atrophaeus]MCY8479934.1 septation ring formation regulator EzrA [Bacillus atrophaeus]MED1125135.1 YiiX/YebB-like N1pC/P60 family cysteine hydrolase [Bacillus atrophaeus]